MQVIDARDGAALPARVVVRDTAGKALRSEYEQLPGVFTGEDGRLEWPLPAGRYTVDVHHGIDHVSQQQQLELATGDATTARFALEPWVRLRELGWANGDAHAHLYSDTKHDEAMTATVRRICRAQGVDFLCANQTWAGYGDADWREGYEKVSDRRFRLFYGAEMPKYRTGHTFWLGLQSTRGAFQGAMDSSFENEYYLVERNPRWTFDRVPFPNIPDLELVARLREAEDAVAVAPHPTSWWWQPRGSSEKYVTNVAASLPAGLLAGGLWDGLVVMGYDHDQFFYQDLWFHVLDEGWRMTPFGELDGGLPPADRFHYGRTRTYLRVGAETTRDTIVAAARGGHSFVSSGPIILAAIEEAESAEAGSRAAVTRGKGSEDATAGASRTRYEPGDVVPADGRNRVLAIEAFASGDREDRLSYVVLFRNGRIHRLWDLRAKAPRRFSERLAVSESARAWYVLKAYGATRRAPEQLEVRAVVEQLTTGTFAGPWPGDSPVALTSPFYFRAAGQPVDPPPLASRLRLRLEGADGAPVRDATVRVLVAGRELASTRATNGAAELRAPVQALLVLEAPGRPTLRRVLYLDYPPQRERLERLASGRWIDDLGGRERWQPGQVPWAAFDLEGARKDLADVDWTVRWQPNERDPLWDEFERRFAERAPR